MQYLMLIYQPEVPPETQRDGTAMEGGELAEYATFNREVHEQGQFIAGEALEPTSTATSVRMRGGQVMVTDGPFAETKEALGGFYLLECRDLDEAIELAARIPGARSGTVEVRPILQLPAEYFVSEGGQG